MPWFADRLTERAFQTKRCTVEKSDNTNAPNVDPNPFGPKVSRVPRLSYSMRPVETRQLFREELVFPTTRRAAIEQVGERELDAPNGDGELVATALRACPEREFETAAGLYAEMMEFLDPTFVGRVGYDDRGGVHEDRIAVSL